MSNQERAMFILRPYLAAYDCDHDQYFGI